MKLKTQIAGIILALAASTSLLCSADAPQQVRGPTIVGVWQVVRHGVDCNTGQERPPFPALVTFHSDGTMTADTSALEGTTNEYGSWQRAPGSQNYSFRDTFFSIDESGALAITGIITANVHLTDANSWTYSATIELFDADGNLIFSTCGRGTATRFE